MKQVDIYIERASTHSRINLLVLDRETGLYEPNVFYIGLGGIRRAQNIRRRKITAWKSEGKKVKGCNYLNDYREELFESLYQPGYTITEPKELYKLYSDHIFYVDGTLLSVQEFGELPLLFIKERIESGKVQLALRKSNA